jgi:protease-4
LGSRGGTVKESRDERYQEVYVSGEKSSQDKIAMIDLVGIIFGQNNGGDSMVEEVQGKLKQALETDAVKAIVVRIDSPGGEVKASDDLYRALVAAREKKPVVVYMDSVAASGGYYAAMGANYIVASDLTITASIGVILQTINYGELAGKIGLKTLTFKSGKMKDLLSPTREMTPEEQLYVQGLIDETYGKFVGIVAKERRLPEAELREGVADGRIVSGNQALAAKLVDALGTLEDAITKAEELSGAINAKVVRLQTVVNFSDVFRLFMQTPHNRSVQVHLSPDTLGLQPGKLYYLSRHLFLGR